MNWDAPVGFSEHKLTDKQVVRVLAMTKALREIPYLSDYVHQIKGLVAQDKIEDAKALWDDLSDEEKTALWVAPKFGGVFTTAERAALHHERAA